ncbi:squalene monooxygenase-like [Protopterus annectens]|uniref:squalene monooxygenase-like n=1 Tax=Protopterus annectens TaxID=7888 RepID=UPI001CFAD70E|nr:squalene monooxygenase-like [Protopterus annectens]
MAALLLNRNSCDITEVNRIYHCEFKLVTDKALPQKHRAIRENTITEASNKENLKAIKTRSATVRRILNKELHAPLTLVADGLFSNLRKHLVPRKAIVTSYFTGTVMKTPPEWKTTKLIILTYETIVVYFYQLSSTETRILINFIGQPPRNLKDYIMENVYPQTPEVLKDPLLTALQNEHLKIIPTMYLPAVAVNKPGVLILGEAYNIRHPFTGGGMSVILNDIKIWRELLQEIPDLYDNEKIFQAKQKFYWLRKKSCSFVVNTLSELLHRLFTTSDDALLLLRKALFCYCNLSEQHALGPVLLTAVLASKPLALFKVNSAVVLYAMYLSIKSELWYTKPRGVCRSIAVLYKSMAASVPLIYSEIKQHNN